MIKHIVPSAALFLLACGGNTNEVNGSYSGQSIDVSDAVLLPLQKDANGNSITLLALESASDACTLLQGQFINNTHIVTVALAIETEDGLLAPATVAGTYSIGGSALLTPGTKIAGVRFGVIGSCGVGTFGDARSGSVHVTHVATNADGSIQHLDGTFEAVFDTSETMSGTFQVSLCPAARLVFAVCR
jgi:hypothetical protein